MKKSLLLVGMLEMGFANAQEGRVGINTENPNATLEVAGQPNNSNVVDGIIAPRLTGPQLRAKTLANMYGANQRGAVVYMTTAILDTANRVGQLVNIDAPGYYYFDGSVWVKFRGEAGATYTAGDGIAINNGVISATGENTNIYTNDGTLAGNRVVSEGANTLTFTGTAEGANKFINTAGTATAQKSPIQIQDGGQAQDRVLTSDADGNATWQLPKVPMEVISLSGLGFVDIPNGINTNLYYTKIAVDVPPGKWWYTFQLAFETTADDSYRKGSTFLRLRFLDGAESNNGAATLSGTATYGGTIRQYYTTPYAYGSKYASVGIPFAGVKNILYGSLGINNTTGATKRFYVYADLMGTANAAGQGQVSNPTTRLHIGSWAETVVTRMPVQ